VSLEALTRVWRESQAEHSDLLIMLALADFMDDHGQAWPSLETIAKKARISRRTVLDRLPLLVSMGELHMESGGGRGGTTLYRLGPHYKGWTEAGASTDGGTGAERANSAKSARGAIPRRRMHPNRNEPKTPTLQERIPVNEGLGAVSAPQNAPGANAAPGTVECPRCHEWVNPASLDMRCEGGHYVRGKRNAA
jgi:hypothetical protein